MKFNPYESSSSIGLEEAEEREPIEPQFVPKYYDYGSSRTLRVEGTRNRFDEKDRENTRIIDRIIDGISHTLAERFHIDPHDVVVLSVPDHEIRRQRNHFAWFALYRPSDHKMYLTFGRTGHGDLLMRMVKKTLQPDDAEQKEIDQEFVSDRNYEENFDPSHVSCVEGLFSPESFHNTIPELHGQRTHAVYRTPLPPLRENKE